MRVIGITVVVSFIELLTITRLTIFLNIDE